MSGETRVLVVANETLASEALAEAVRRRAEAGPVRFAVVAPVNPPRQGYVVGRLRADAGVPVQHVVVETEAGVPA